MVAGATPSSLSISWTPTGGFNIPSLSWEWEDSNHSPVGASPLTFSTPSSTSTFSGGTYTPLPLFTLTNTPAGGGSPPDGLQTYFFAVTISNGITTATKYFPFYFDLSLAQNFCGAVPSSAHGFGGGTLIHGSWSKSAVVAMPALSSSRAAATTAAAGALPDLRVNSSDITFMPSIPKTGDNVQFRFRVGNAGNADAVHVPIAVMVNGVGVVTDTFDVPAGHVTLAQLDWNNAQMPKGLAPVGRPDRAARPDLPPQGKPVVAAIAIDPQHTTQQKTPTEKMAPVPHFTLRDPSIAGPVAVSNSQRILLEIGEGGCIAFRLATGGTAPCGSGDVDLTVEDVGKGTYALSAAIGIADVTARLGPALGSTAPTAAQLAAASFSSQASGVAGHVYAVQLSGGQIGVLALDSIRSPQQLDARARALFRRAAIRVLGTLGGSSGPAEPGDTSGGQAGIASVFMEIRVVVP